MNYSQVAYDLENIKDYLNRKLDLNAPVVRTKEQLFGNFPFKDINRYSSTFRQTMRNRPEILQTTKPMQIGDSMPNKFESFKAGEIFNSHISINDEKKSHNVDSMFKSVQIDRK